MDFKNMYTMDRPLSQIADVVDWLLIVYLVPWPQRRDQQVLLAKVENADRQDWYILNFYLCLKAPRLYTGCIAHISILINSVTNKI